ncbi:hypothetical protein FB446DRAFT_795550 [Lentinula raphanica]|nr:hypothetical protein FB446DRAFT_795550 [Lentinula raphanica]
MPPPSEQPRNLPQFPLPPENTSIVPRLMHPCEEDIISNPSEEEHGEYLSLDLQYPPSGLAQGLDQTVHSLKARRRVAIAYFEQVGMYLEARHFVIKAQLIL